MVRIDSPGGSAFAAEQIQSTTLAVIELISRDVRVSDICPTSSVCSPTVLEMNHPVRGLIRYTFIPSQVKITRTEGGSTVDATSRDVFFERFDLLTSQETIDCRQPRVTVVITARNTVGPAFRVRLQTTTTSRDLRKELLFPPSPCP